MKILFTGGGTLGSVTPLLAVFESLRKTQDGVQGFWVGTKEGPERKTVERYGLEYHAISSGRLRRFAALSNLLTPFLVVAGVVQSISLLKKLRPNVVVSAGGFVAVPVVWAARILGVSVHVHQMDWRPGLANKLAAPFASSVSVVFEKSVNDFSGVKAEVTGNPVRPEVFSGNASAARARFGLEDDVPVVLVLGGGTGALNLNRLVAEAAPAICRQAQIIHVTGKGKGVEASEHSGRYHRCEFLGEDMGHVYAVTDLVITRAGMGTLTELAALSKPSVVVPIPGSHQAENARFFADQGAALYFEEARGSRDLAEEVIVLLGDSGRLGEMSKAASSLNRPEAADAVAQAILRSARADG
jgi:UDP-N-acetylglucosamine--N-acetylmuramyl-(pentapeptide) pyrophosphoryl-undecaprenol N-acetylglucosamine transferase